MVRLNVSTTEVNCPSELVLTYCDNVNLAGVAGLTRLSLFHCSKIVLPQLDSLRLLTMVGCRGKIEIPGFSASLRRLTLVNNPDLVCLERVPKQADQVLVRCPRMGEDRYSIAS